MPTDDISVRNRPQGLVDILDKILDKGLVVAGDIKVSLANVELLTIQLRLVICSVDKAQSIGIDWWRRDRFYSGTAGELADNQIKQLQERISDLEKHLGTPKSVREPVKGKGR